MMNQNHIVVFDFETGGLDPHSCEVIEVAAKAYNCRTLEPFDGGEFCMLIQPTDYNNLSKEALEKNGIKVEDLKSKGVDVKIAWNEFICFVNKFNKKGDEWNAPVPAGSNIRGFDLIIAKRLNRLYGPKKEKTVLFNDFKSLDLLDILFMWFENCNEPKKFKMDELRPFFGLSVEGSHRAMKDVEDAGQLIMKFLKLHRNLGQKIKFKKSCGQ